MARQGSLRHHKVLSSGRLTGSTKVASSKKQIPVRKVAHSNVDSGYSLYSTDSEDQVTSIHHGLDRCAALLKDILQNESEGMANICQKTGNTAIVRTTSRPLLNKGKGSKKRGLKKKLPSVNVHKEIVPMSNRKPASANVTAAGKDTVSVNTQKVPAIQPIHVPCSQHSPVTHQKLCEHVQTQMSLLNMQAPQKSGGVPEVPLSTIPENTYQHVTAFNFRLPTSTPALSPEHAANPALVQPGVSMDNCSQCGSQAGPVLLPAGSSASTSAPQLQPVVSCSVLPHLTQPGPNGPTPSTVLAPPASREALSDQGIHDPQQKETDLIQRIQAHLALLQTHEKESGKSNEKDHGADPIQPKPLNSREETADEYSEGTVSEEEDLNGVDVAPVKDTSCQTSFDKDVLKPKKPSQQKTSQKLKTVKYLLGELKALLTDHDDSDILRLLDEVEDTVSLFPAAVGSTNVQAEIALALQPLRSENAQLRRRLRILNQQLKHQERAEKECHPDSNFELISLQALNLTLKSELNECMQSIELLQNKNEELIQISESQKEENKRLTRIIHEKEKDLLEKRQHYDNGLAKLKIEIDELLADKRNFQYKLESAEKENQILVITLRQRDAEVNRLCELTRALQGSMSKLLSDLTVGTAKPKQERGLSKAALEIHENQLQHDAYPLSDSIMNYLKKLETDPVLFSAKPPLSKPEIKEPNQVPKMKGAEQPPQRNTVAEETAAPRKVFSFLKPDVVAASNSSASVEGHEPNEPIYIPLSHSPSWKPATVTERRTNTHHPIPQTLDHSSRLGASEQPDGLRMLGNAKACDKFYGSHSPKNAFENNSEMMERIAELEGKKHQMQPKEITNGAAKVILDNPDRLQPDKFLCAPISHQKGDVQKKGTGMSAPNSSFSTFDWMSGKSEWTISSLSTFTSRDEEDFKNGLAALDANIARLQKTLQSSLEKKMSP
ncbi:coiled-coil domain-containing protein 14 isoform X2 [Varanus komodoensis]|uniref:coiled-coil domain-containing protein 14 isoform X2 n=1 Tax=Varanus komodoensis TaxID=61221 RepID=UPI001CF7DB92|nr:coiled-coil domain-containing protein 14 isoform X2 [Varanus komodoensis]